MNSQPSSNPQRATIEYYDQHAQAFVDATLAIGLSPLCNRFLTRLPKAAHIPDAGCGSGRDTFYFMHAGHTVEAIDDSPEMARLAGRSTGLSIAVRSFAELDYDAKVDGIWACASLLHVAHDQLDDVSQRLARALKLGGILYVSFKYGIGQRFSNGRLFSDFGEITFDALISQHRELALVDQWISNDIRPDRPDEKWLNALLLKEH